MMMRLNHWTLINYFFKYEQCITWLDGYHSLHLQKLYKKLIVMFYYNSGAK